MDKLPSGLDSNLTKMFDSQGLELSGGQWQKLAITRFFSKAGMLIFDEPSSALDEPLNRKYIKIFQKVVKIK